MPTTMCRDLCSRRPPEGGNREWPGPCQLFASAYSANGLRIWTQAIITVPLDHQSPLSRILTETYAGSTTW